MKWYFFRFYGVNPATNKEEFLGDVRVNDMCTGPNFSVLAKAFRHAKAICLNANKYSVWED